MGSITRRSVVKLGFAALFASRSSLAQTEWPSRPVRFVIPFPPGGGGDTVARAVADKTAEILKQAVVIENRTGGNAVIAASAVAQAAPDGYTYLWDGNNHLTNRSLVKDIPFDYRKAFVPVTLLARYPQVIAVRSDFPAKDFDEFIAYAKANPGKVSIGTPPSGGMGHLGVELLASLAGVKFIRTPYRGGPDAVRDLMGSQIDAVMLTTSTIRPAMQANKARVLAVTSAKRSTLYPDAPAIGERYPGYDMDDWNGLFAPTGTPPDIVKRMSEAVGQALRDPAVVGKISPLGTVLASSTPEEFGRWLEQQGQLMDKIIRDANITLTA